MITGPKYKIARRVGAPIFEKTQTAKYAQRQERKGKSRGFSKPKSEFGSQLNEKQKARIIYGMSEHQFARYVKEALAKKTSRTSHLIYQYLERRLDNVVYRLGFAPTRRAARQMIVHGHMTVNGRKVNTPSRQMVVGDMVGVRVGSQGSALFTREGTEDVRAVPAWLRYDNTKKTGEVVGMPDLTGADTMFDLNAVVEFYSR